MRTPTSHLAALIAWTLVTTACSGGSGSEKKGELGLTTEERDKLRACVLDRLPTGDVAGYDLVQAFRACRPPTDAAEDAKAFAATMDGFAAPVDGSVATYRIAR